jgi:subtilisin family serine protease
MKLLIVSVFALVASFPLSAQSQQKNIQAVFRLTPAAQRQNVLPGARQVTFGLSERAINRIYTLSRGRVDFRNIFTVAVSNRSNLQSLQTRSGYQGAIFPNVPPPFFMGAPGDPAFSGQWWVQKHNVEAAWNLATGRGVVIADCDAGYYLTETDIASNMLSQFRFSLSDPENPYEVSKGGYITHGTAVSAIMSGVIDGHGTNGIAYEAKTVPLQNYTYSSRDKVEKEEATARCILHAMKIQQVRIIVLENQTANGSSETFVGTREAVKLALAAGMTIVSAGGNYSKELLVEEQNNTGSIIVGALNPDGSKASFSNYGKRIAVAAYGSGLHTLCGPNGAMCEFGGTSGATPQVAAAVALMLQANPRLLPEQIKFILEKTRITNQSNATVGGLLNLVEAVRTAKETPVSTERFHRRQQIRRQAMDILKQQ